MSQQSQSLPGTDRIRALDDEDSIFQAFDAYPWTKDKMFMSGLYAILGEPNRQDPQASLSDMAIHARIFYYAQRIGVTIDFARYQAWLAQHPHHTAPSILPEEWQRTSQPGDQGSDSSKKESDQPPVLDWQKAAPKADLYVDRRAQAQTQQAQAQAQASTGDEPNYPMGFAEMLKLIQAGKPIPGIRQIPNTIVRDPAVKPVGTRAAPKKPWEKDNTAIPVLDASVPKALDADFPPVEADGPTPPEA